MRLRLWVDMTIRSALIFFATRRIPSYALPSATINWAFMSAGTCLAAKSRRASFTVFLAVAVNSLGKKPSTIGIPMVGRMLTRCNEAP